MKQGIYYVHPVGMHTNGVIAQRLEQETMTSIAQKNLKGGGTISVYECSAGIVEELYRSKRRMQLSFTLYMLDEDVLVPADASHLETVPEPDEVPTAPAGSHRHGRSATPHRKGINAILA